MTLLKMKTSHHHKWTDEELDTIRRDYDGHNASARMIAGRLGVTFSAVKGQAACMGILQNKSPDWTQREIDSLSEWIHQYSKFTIARKLNRSLNAVSVKAKRLNMSLRARDGWYTQVEVAEILGVDHKKVQRWIDSGVLNASWHTDGRSMRHINESDLRIFIINHSFELSGRNVDLFQIVAILTGGPD